jgi:hypothetical protein
LFAEPSLVEEPLFADGSLELIVAEPSFAEPSLVAEPKFEEPLFAEPLFAEPAPAAEHSSHTQCCPNATTNGSLEPIVAEPLFAEPSLTAEPVFADGSLELIAEPIFAELLFAEPLFAEPSQVAEHSPRLQCCPNATTKGFPEPIFAEPLSAEPSLVAEPLCADGSLELNVAEPWLSEPSLVAELSFAEPVLAESLFAEPSLVAEHSPRTQCCPNATCHAPGRESQTQPNPHSREEHIWPWPNDPVSSQKHIPLADPCAQLFFPETFHTAPCPSVAPQRNKCTCPDPGQILAASCRTTQKAAHATTCRESYLALAR